MARMKRQGVSHGKKELLGLYPEELKRRWRNMAAGLPGKQLFSWLHRGAAL